MKAETTARNPPTLKEKVRNIQSALSYVSKEAAIDALVTSKGNLADAVTLLIDEDEWDDSTNSSELLFTSPNSQSSTTKAEPSCDEMFQNQGDIDSTGKPVNMTNLGASLCKPFVQKNTLSLPASIQTIRDLSASITSSVQSLRSSKPLEHCFQSMLDRIESSASIIHSLSSDGDFVQFKQLPTELRHAIWKFALPGPRVVEVVPSYAAQKCQKLQLNVGMPALMHVCRESRQIALSKYSVKLANKNVLPLDCARFDPKEETIYVPDVSIAITDVYSEKLFSDEAINSIQWLAINAENLCDQERNFAPVDFTKFSSLKALWLHPDYDEHRCTSFDCSAVGTDITVVDYPKPELECSFHAEEALSGMYYFMDKDKNPNWKVPEVKYKILDRQLRRPRRKFWE